MGEHMARYDAFCKFLTGRGFAVCIYDLAGHGRTAPSPEKLGYFGSQNGCRTMLDDVQEAADRALALLRAAYPGHADPGRVIFGHSMGAFIGQMYCIRPGVQLAGAVFSGTSGPNLSVYLGLYLAQRSIRRFGPLYRDEQMARKLAAVMLKRIKPVRTPWDWLSRDEAVVDAYIADPLCGFTLTAAGYRDMYTWLRLISRPDWAGKVPAGLPILLVSGDQDPLGKYGNGPRVIRQRLLLTGHHVIMKLYAGSRHEILNDINRQEVWQDLAIWMTNLAQTREREQHS